MRDHVGVVERVWIDSDRKGRVLVRFGKGARATEIFDDVKDGIRCHVSVGYSILEAFVEKRGEDGEADTVRVTDWEPFEVSFVSVPADASVGVGRSREPNETQNESSPLEEGFFIPEKKERTMSEANEVTAQEAAPAKAVDVQAVTNQARENERSRISKINSIGERFGKTELASEYIKNDKSVADFRSAVMDQMNPETETVPASQLDMTASEVRNYSVMKAVRAAISGDWSGAGFERECSLAIADKTGKEARGFYLPYNIQTRASVGAATGGATLVGTDHLGGSFIDNLRANSLMGQLGATFLTGLVGNVDVPRKDGSSAFYWLDEDEDVTASDLVLGSVGLTPKTVAGSIPMTRRLMKQSSPDIEALVLADLTRGASLAIDKAAFIGTGANGQPTGIFGQAGVNTATVADAGNAPTWAELVAFETALADDEALEGSLHYVTTPTLRGALKTTPKDAGSGLFLMENGEANGYPVHSASQLAAGQSVLGNFNDVLIGMWGVLDIMPDQAAKAASGGLVLRVFQDVDVAVRHPESFCISV